VCSFTMLLKATFDMQVNFKKIKLIIGLLICNLSLLTSVLSQVPNKDSFSIVYHYIDSIDYLAFPKIKSTFANKDAALEYILGLPKELANNGFLSASIDSFEINDSVAHVMIFFGKQYQQSKLNLNLLEKNAQEEIAGSLLKINNKTTSLHDLEGIKNKLLAYYEKKGYPFASVFYDSIRLEKQTLTSNIKIDKGTLYTIDSIRTYGNLNVSKSFIKHYLRFSNEYNYTPTILSDVDKRLSDLDFLSIVQPSDLTMLSNSSILNLYLQPKKSSQFNFLIGFQPSSRDANKTQLTGDINLNLKNYFAMGERVLFKWQQFEVNSPRLNIGYSQPFIFNTDLGFDFLFDLFKMDSNFIQIDTKLAFQHYISANNIGKLFFQFRKSNLLEGAIDTALIKQIKALPVNADMSSNSIGLSYQFNNTNYILNPKKGNDFVLSASLGNKKIKINNQITSISSKDFDYSSLYDSVKRSSYEMRLQLKATHFFPIRKSTTIKAGLQTGYYESPSVFRNDLFQIGGIANMRGFDEGSIYANKYAIFTSELRVLNGINSFFAFFSDVGFVQKKYQKIITNNSYIGFGIGINYETKIGMLSINYSLGKRNDVDLNLNQGSKIHVGYINYF